MFDARRLQCLHAVHVHGSVLDAALELGLTSSAVSQQIGKLEREVGATLLQRAGRGVVLTDAARVLVEAAEEITEVTERATARLEDLRGDLSGTLRIASFPSAIGPVVAPVLAQLRAEAPDLHVQLHEMFPDRASDAVIGGHVDVAVIHLWGTSVPPTTHDLASTVVGDDVFDVLVPATHALAGESAISLRQLMDDVWVTDDLEGFCRKWLIRRMTEMGRRPRIDYRVDEIAGQLALVSAGLCDALLPRLAFGTLPDTIARLPLTGSAPFRRLHALYRQNAASRPAVRRFVDLIDARLPGAHIVD